MEEPTLFWAAPEVTEPTLAKLELASASVIKGLLWTPDSTVQFFYLQLYLSYPLPVLVLAGNAIFSALLLLDLLMQFLFTSYQSRLRGKTAVTSVYVD